MAMSAMLAVSAVQNVAKVVGTLNTLRNFEKSVNDPCVEEFLLIWHEMEAMEVPMRLLLKLHAREATRTSVDAAVRFANTTIHKLEDFLASDDADDARPDSSASWTAWLAAKKQGRDKKEQLPVIAQRVQRTMQTMQLALQTVQMTHPEYCTGHVPISYSPTTVTLASAIMTEIRAGRMNVGNGGKAIAAGVVLIKNTAQGGGSLMEDVGRCVVSLGATPETEEGEWSIKVGPAPQTGLRAPDDDDDSDPVDMTFAISSSFNAIRREPTDKTPISYLFSAGPGSDAILLKFEAVGRTGTERAETSLSAELFETLLYMMKYRDYAIDTTEALDALAAEFS